MENFQRLMTQGIAAGDHSDLAAENTLQTGLADLIVVRGCRIGRFGHHENGSPSFMYKDGDRIGKPFGL
jgi:hypothetical protein